MFETELSDRISVDNVVIFISDSLRYDHTPPSLSDLGIMGKAIAPSIYTASSIPSMFSGLYPARHCVWDFDSGLNSKTVFEKVDNSGYYTNYMFNWPINAVRAGDDPTQLSELDHSNPFLFVQHDLGGHVPYGDTTPSEWNSMREYYESYQPQEHQDRYADSVSQSVQSFKKLLQTLENDDLLDETLVIFVSDHGELLGERGGVWGHGSVISPELVEVPMLFTGGGLPRGERYGRLLSGIDIAPTILSIFGLQIPERIEGTNLWSSIPPENRKVRSDIWNRTINNRVNYAATSMWDSNGGYVTRIGSWSQHALFMLVNHLFRYNQASLTRSLSLSKLYELYSVISNKVVQYKSPSFSFNAVEDNLPKSFDEESVPTTEPDTTQLRQLGYLE